MGRLKVKRTGIIAVAMVVAFLSLGTAYASWTDYVETDTTDGGDIVVVDYSCSAIYKYLGTASMDPLDGGSTILDPADGSIDTDDLVSWHGWCDDDPYVEKDDFYPVASAGAAPGQEDDSVVVWFDNMFPCQWLTADILVGYDGPGPAQLQAEIVEGSVGGDQDLIDNLEVEFLAYELDPDFLVGSDPHSANPQPVDVGVEVDPGALILIAMRAHLPQDNSLMGLDGSFTARIYASGEEQQQGTWEHGSAWADGTRYVEKHWSMYVTYTGTAKTVTLYQGQTNDAGDVTFEPDGGKVRITITLNEGYRLSFPGETTDNLHIQGYDTAPTEKPKPGHFEYKGHYEDTDLPIVIVVDAHNYYGVHANVDLWVPSP